jgi:hypothetical protein
MHVTRRTARAAQQPRKAVLAWSVLLVFIMAGLAHAANLGEMVVKTVAVGAVVSAVAKPANSGLNKLVGGNAPGVATRVVPVLSVGEKGYVGAAQVVGSQALVGKTKAVLQFEKSFDNQQYRIKLLMPISSANPLNAKRVRGVGISGLLDIALSHNSYLLPPSEGFNVGDVLKAGAIAVATTQFGSQINGFINTVFHNEASTPDGVTKVVPYLSVGTKSYIGMMQVAGPPAQVGRVKAVWQYDQLFDSGRVRLRALVPSDSVNPLSIHRVKGVGCTAVIDAMVLRAKEAETYPNQYRYFERAPLFVGMGEDPHYRPPGWDRGRKVGWIKQGNPLLPPGQAKKQAPRILVLPGVTQKPLPPGQAKKLERRSEPRPFVIPGLGERKQPAPGHVREREREKPKLQSVPVGPAAGRLLDRGQDRGQGRGKAKGQEKKGGND